MYFLVYFAVLRIDDEFQLAHAHRIVPLPHLRWCESDTDADANAHADCYTEANEPYGPADGVTHTLRRHALPRRLPNLMIEIRSDLIDTPPAQARIASALAELVRHGVGALAGASRGAA